MSAGPDSPNSGVKRGLIVAALLIVASAAFQLLSPRYVSRDVGLRIMGILTGVVVLIYANLVPKALTPLMRTCGDPIVEQSVRRFTGWTLAIGGAAYALTWMFAPVQYATAIAVSFLGACVLLVVVRIAIVVSSGPRT